MTDTAVLENQMVNVRVGRLGQIRMVSLYNGTCTVKGALEAAGIAEVAERDVRLNTRETTLDSPVTENDTVLVLQPIRGA